MGTVSHATLSVVCMRTIRVSRIRLFQISTRCVITLAYNKKDLAENLTSVFNNMSPGMSCWRIDRPF